MNIRPVGALRAISGATLALWSSAAPTIAAQCSAVVSAYQDAVTQYPGLLPPIFEDGWDWQSGQPYQYASSDGTIVAEASCGADGELSTLRLSMGFDPSTKIHTLLSFSETTSAVGFVYLPDTGTMGLMPKSMTPSDDGTSAIGDAVQSLDANNTAKVEVQANADGSGTMTFWINPQ